MYNHTHCLNLVLAGTLEGRSRPAWTNITAQGLSQGQIWGGGGVNKLLNKFTNLSKYSNKAVNHSNK